MDKFSKNLQDLLHQPGFPQVSAILKILLDMIKMNPDREEKMIFMQLIYDIVPSKLIELFLKETSKVNIVLI